MLVVFFIGLMMWLAYGVLLKAPAIIVANIVTGMLVVLSIILKARIKKPEVASAAQRRSRLRIAIDMDEVMADSLLATCSSITIEFGTNLRKQDLRGRPLHLSVPDTHRSRLDEIAFRMASSGTWT